MTRVLSAPAKLNLGLEVVGRRDDGYHQLSSILASVSLADSVELTPGQGLSIRGPHARGVPADPAQNLASLALASLQSLADRPLGQALTLTKNIPAAAGLGGGSADAAAVLRAAASLGVVAGRDQLQALALDLGADVPFQLVGGMALVGGVGEEISELPNLEMWFAVAYPGIAVSTAEVFAELRPEEWSDGGSVAAAAGALREVVAGGPGVGGADELALPANALQAPATRRYPALADAADALRSAGWTPRMTGSGSALYHLSVDEAEARSLKAAAAQAGVASWVCHTLPPHPW